MLRKIGLFLLTAVLTVSGSSAVLAAELDTGSESLAPGLIISEIYPNAPGSSESGHEYIELHNQSDTWLDLTGYLLYRENSATINVLDGLGIDPDGYLVILPTFSLLNSGGKVILEYPVLDSEEVIALAVEYPSLDEQHSWSLVGQNWQPESPTPGEANPAPPEIIKGEDQEQDEAVILCDTSTVFINEIVANPSGADTNGGEYVEVYNGGTEAVSLAGCAIDTDKASNIWLPDIMLDSDSYYAIPLFDKLLNGGGTVTFLAYSDEYGVDYPKLGDNESWSNIDGVWQVSKLQTPGAKNQPTPVDSTTAELDDLASCPEGKYRNPDTNRCRNIVDTASSLLPCPAGKIRNPLTNRCRNVTSSGSQLTPCKTGQERNPATNRCRNIAVTGSQLTPCQAGYERNPDTNRCRKSGTAVLGVADFPEPGPTELHNGVLVIGTLLALAYGVYEYRFDLENWYSKLRQKHAKSN